MLHSAMTDWQSLDTPYRIPGPAGGHDWRGTLFADSGYARETRAARSGTISHLANNKASSSKFHGGAWYEALCELGVITNKKPSPRSENKQTSGRKTLSESVALLQAYSLASDVYKAERLVVEIDALSHVGKDVSVTLADPTGTIAGTLHSSAMEAHKEVIRAGCVLVLVKLTAITYAESQSVGFRVDPTAGVHVSIHLSNVENVFPATTEHAWTIQDPLASYEKTARNPRMYPQQRPIKRSRVMSQSLQHRPSPAPANVRNGYGKSTSVRQPFRVRSPVNPPVLSCGSAHYQPRIASSYNRKYPTNPIARSPLLPRQNLQRTPVELRQPATVVSDINDDILDDILGNVDIDAAIAASGKCPAVASGSDPQNSRQNHGTQQNQGRLDSSAPTSRAAADNPSATLVTHASKPDPIPTSFAETVDDEIIANLMEGLDGDDFIDV